MKRLLSVIALLLALVTAGCSSSGFTGHSGTGSSAVTACTSLAGKPVGKETKPQNPNDAGKLSSPPKACEAAAVLVGGSYGCYPTYGKRVGDFFYYTTANPIHVTFGKPGGVWHVHKGNLNVDKDTKTVGC